MIYFLIRLFTRISIGPHSNGHPIWRVRELLFSYCPFKSSDNSFQAHFKSLFGIFNNDTPVYKLPKLLQTGDSIICLNSFNYLMSTNVPNTSHLPWRFCSPPPNELTSRYLSLDEQWLELPRQFQTSSQINVVILAQKKFSRTNLPTFYRFSQLPAEYKSNIIRNTTEVRANLGRKSTDRARW